MAVSANELYHLAAELTHEHGRQALDFARRAVVTFEAEGAADRAQFWLVMSVLIDDIMMQRVDPHGAFTIQ